MTNATLDALRSAFGINGNSATSSTGNSLASTTNKENNTMRKTSPYSIAPVAVAEKEVAPSHDIAHPLNDRQHLFTMDAPSFIQRLRYHDQIIPIIASPKIFLKAEAEIVGVALGIYDFLNPAWGHDPLDFSGGAFVFDFENKEFCVGVRAEKFAYGNDPVERTRYVHYKASVTIDDNGEVSAISYDTPMNYRDSRVAAVKAMDVYNSRIGLDNKFYTDRYWFEMNQITGGTLNVPLVREDGVWTSAKRPPMITPWAALLHIALIEESVENEWEIKIPPFHFTEYSFVGVARGYQWAAKHWGKQIVCVK